MNIYFVHNAWKNSNIRKVGFGKTTDSCYHVVEELLKFYNIAAPYIRSWQEDNGDTWVDFGSYSDFIILSKTEELENE